MTAYIYMKWINKLGKRDVLQSTKKQQQESKGTSDGWMGEVGKEGMKNEESYVHVPTPHKDCNHYALHTCSNEVKFKNKQMNKNKNNTKRNFFLT